MLEVATVKCAESVAQVGEVGVVDRVESREQEQVTESADHGDVQRPAATDEPRPLHEVVAIGKEMYVVADLLWRHAAVRVHHYDEVAGGRLESGAQCAAFSGALLSHDPQVRPVCLRGDHRDIGRVAVDKDDFVHVVRDLLEHGGDVASLVPYRDDQADTGADRGVRPNLDARERGLIWRDRTCKVQRRSAFTGLACGRYGCHSQMPICLWWAACAARGLEELVITPTERQQMSMWLDGLDRSAPARSIEFEPSKQARQTGRRLCRGMSCRLVMMSTNIMAASLLW